MSHTVSCLQRIEGKLKSMLVPVRAGCTISCHAALNALGLIGSKRAQAAMAAHVRRSTAWRPQTTIAFVGIKRPVTSSLLSAMAERVTTRSPHDDGQHLLAAAAIASRARSEDQGQAPGVRESVTTIDLALASNLREAMHDNLRWWAPLHNKSRTIANVQWDSGHEHVRIDWVAHHAQLSLDAHAWEVENQHFHGEHEAEARNMLQQLHLERLPGFTHGERSRQKRRVVTALRAAGNARSPVLAPLVCEWLSHHDELVAQEAANALSGYEGSLADKHLMTLLRSQLHAPSGGHRVSPKVTTAILKTLLKWERISSLAVSEAVHQLLRLPAGIANVPPAMCEEQCCQSCNPHRPFSHCKKRCHLWCRHELQIASLLKQLVERATQPPNGHDLHVHLRRHRQVAHPSHEAPRYDVAPSNDKPSEVGATNTSSHVQVASRRRLKIDFASFTTTFFETTFSHPSADVDYDKKIVLLTVGGKKLDVGASARFKMVNDCYSRLGLFGGAFSINLHDEVHASGTLVGYDWTLIDAKLQFEFAATFRLKLAEDLVNFIADTLEDLGVRGALQQAESLLGSMMSFAIRLSGFACSLSEGLANLVIVVAAGPVLVLGAGLYVMVTSVATLGNEVVDHLATAATCIVDITDFKATVYDPCANRSRSM